MKYMSLALLLLLFSCRKDLTVSDTNETLKQNSLSYLEHNYPSLYSQIDASQMYVIEQPGGFIRIGFKGKNIGEEMVILKANSQNHIDGGKIIQLRNTDSLLNGHIAVYSLNEQLIVEADLFHGDVLRRKSPYPSAAIVIEEEQINSPMLAKRYATEGIDRPFTIVEYINVSRAYNNLAQATSTSAYYSQRYPEQKNDYGGSGGTTAAPYTILIDQESTTGKTGLNMKQMIDCFYTIPDAGATCTMELMADIPADADPYALFDWMSGSPGHCFIKLTKKAGVRIMTTHIGLYPETPFKSTATTAPINGKFFDNGKHEYNASMRMNISTGQLDKILSFLQKKALLPKYDIDDYNCSDFAVEVFNLARPTNPINPPRVRIPESMTPNGSITPQSVYLELQRLKKTSAAERANIYLPTTKTYTGSSVSPCK